MKISELTPKQGNVDIELDITEIGPVREFSKFGKSGRVATAVGRDDAGSTINVSLWNEQVEQVKQGDRVHIKNGFVSEWQGEKQLTTGRMGSLEVLAPSAEKLVEEAEGDDNGKDNSDVKEEDVV